MKVLIGATAVTIAAGLAFATPIINLTSPVVAAGNDPNAIDVHGGGTATNGSAFHIQMTSEGPSTISSQVASLKAGGENGWHSHPGLVTVTLTQGSIVWYNERCEPTTYNAGDAWVEGGKLHVFRVLGAETVVLYATFVTAEGDALRTDEPAPACATAMGLT